MDHQYLRGYTGMILQLYPDLDPTNFFQSDIIPLFITAPVPYNF